MAKNDAYLNADNSPESDNCLTPRYGVVPIVKHLKARGYKKIWCPFDADHSFFVRVLTEEGFTVIHGCLESGKDFFRYEPDDYDCIVSNPPFSCKDKILTRLFGLGKPFAVILPQNALQSLDRVDMFIKYGLEYLGFNRRLCFYTKGELAFFPEKNHFASAYFCKDVLPQSLVFEELVLVQEPYFSLEDMF